MSSGIPDHFVDDNNDNDDCKDDNDGDYQRAYQVYESDDDDGESGDYYYSGKLEEACLNCVVDPIVIKDANHILKEEKNNVFIHSYLILTNSYHWHFPNISYLSAISSSNLLCRSVGRSVGQSFELVLASTS